MDAHQLNELEQPAFTHANSIAQSKIDRIYMNHHVSEQLDKQFSASVGALRLLYDILLARKLDNEALRARRTGWGVRHGNTKF